MYVSMAANTTGAAGTTRRCVLSQQDQLAWQYLLYSCDKCIASHMHSNTLVYYLYRDIRIYSSK